MADYFTLGIYKLNVVLRLPPSNFKHKAPLTGPLADTASYVLENGIICEICAS